MGEWASLGTLRGSLGLMEDRPLTLFSGPGACCSRSRRPWRKGEGPVRGMRKASRPGVSLFSHLLMPCAVSL